MWNQAQFTVLFVALGIAVKVNGMNITCFSSTLPEAPQLQLVFDLKNDDKNLWKNTDNSPLPACNFSSISSSSWKCTPCIDRSVKPETVHVLCQNLTGNEIVMMEASNANRTDPKIDFNDTNCPPPPTPSPGDDQSGWWRDPKIIGSIVGVIFAIGVVAWAIYAIIKHLRAQPNGNNGRQRGAENGAADGLLHEMKIGNGTANGHVRGADIQEEKV